MIRIPVFLMMMISGLFLFWAKLTGWSPPIIPSYVRRYNHHWMISGKKAEEVLDFHPVSLAEGLQKTLDWIRSDDDDQK
jgi:nucleoside-diphosphate-sugar epimerase